jgi:hypothetical protein
MCAYLDDLTAIGIPKKQGHPMLAAPIPHHDARRLEALRAGFCAYAPAFDVQ